ncbi:MAG: 50S ribosomal protein L25/general stress protein Ctc [Bacteroidia bacterium]
MKTVSLSGSLRANVGSKDAAELRAKGMVPCVLYGGAEQIHFYTDTRNFKDIIFTPNVSLVEIDVDGKKYPSILQEAQYHKINDRLIHADFLLVSDDKPVTMEIPVKPVGTSEGVRAGGKLMIKLRKLRVRGLAKNLPDTIDLSIENLGIGKSIAVGDIKMEGVEFLNKKDVTVISVNVTRAVAADAVEEKKAAAPATTAAAPAKK